MSFFFLVFSSFYLMHRVFRVGIGAVFSFSFLFFCLAVVFVSGFMLSLYPRCIFFPSFFVLVVSSFCLPVFCPLVSFLAYFVVRDIVVERVKGNAASQRTSQAGYAQHVRYTDMTSERLRQRRE